MIYWLYDYFQDEYIRYVRIFKYVSVRAIMAFISALIINLVLGKFVINYLISLKAGQPIRGEEVIHKLHEKHSSKAGTPTMGGILIIGSVFISAILWCKLNTPYLLLCLFTMIYLGLLGFYDDYLKVVKKNSKGVSAKTKLSLQIILGITVALVILFLNKANPEKYSNALGLYLPIIKVNLLENWGYYTVGILIIVYCFMIVATSNAVNLTDGLDGLAIGCTITTSIAYGIINYLVGRKDFSAYLHLPYIPDCNEISIFCSALAGASLGFLWFNCHPAKIFMGDTGSLSIGGIIGIIAILSKQEFLLPIIGFIFVIEALSVMIQVASFKIFGKRVFLMSPIHHHFELKGWHENQVIIRFWILSGLFAVIGLALLKR